MFGYTKTKLQKNPYPGIRSFETEESHLFFGRNKQIKDLYTVLLKTHFIAVTGASGSGKSSLIKAGLIPELYKNNKNWSHCIFRPGNNPIKNFANAIAQKDIFKITASEAEKIIRNSNNSLQYFFKSQDENLKHLIYIDQFEEIFRFKQTEHSAENNTDTELFTRVVVDLVKSQQSNVFIVLSLRTDFLGDCSEFSGLTDVINKGHYLIPKMTLEEKEEALTGPAKVSGAEISPNLKNLIKEHLRIYNVSLPVFQHALMRTWDYWLENAEYGKPVDIEHYEAIGTVSQALSVHAEYIYSSLRDEHLKKIAEKIFKSLTYLGFDNRGTRSPKSFFDIVAILNERKEDIQTVLDVFRDEKNGFLMPPVSTGLKPDTLIDISHESIMRVWDRLVRWVQNETESAQLYIRLSKSAELYQEGKTGLLKNPDLQLALNWLRENKPNEVWAKRYDPAFDRAVNYIIYSKKKWENEIKAKEEKQRRGLKRARFFAVFLGSASLISILFLVIAINLKFKADDSKRKALEKERIAVAKSIIAEEKKKEAVSNKRIAEQQQLIAEEQRLLAEKNKKYAVQQQKEALLQKKLALIAEKEAVRARDIARELQVKAEVLRDDALRQKQLAEEQKERAEISEAKTDTLRRLAIAKSLAVSSVKLYFDNQKTKKNDEYSRKLPGILALQAYYFNKRYKGNPNDAEIFSALSEVSNNAVILRGKKIHSDGIRQVAMSKDGKYFVSCSDDGTVKLFQTKNPENFKNLQTPYISKNEIRSADIDEKGRKIVAGTYNGDIMFWKNTELQEKATVLKEHNSIVNSVKFSKDFKSVYSVSNDGSLKKTDITESPNNSISIYKTNERLLSLALSSGNENIAVGTASGKIIIFPAGNYSDRTVIQDDKNNRVMSLVWKNPETLIAGYSSGLIKIFKNNKTEYEFYAHISGVSTVIYDNNFNRLITASYDGTVKIWNYDNLKLEPISFNNHTSWVYSVALSPDGKIIISGGADKKIVINSVVAEDLVNNLRKNITKNMNKNDWLRFIGKDIAYSSALPE